MKFKKLLLLFVLAGCSVDHKNREAETKAENEKQFQNPATVGHLADGKAVRVIEYRQCPGCTIHYIYFVGEDITVNTRSNKTDTVYVMLNGKQLTVLQAQIELTAQDAKNKADELKRIRSPHN